MHPPFEPARLVPLLRFADGLLRGSVRFRVQDPDALVDAVRAGKSVVFVCRHGQLWPVLWAVRGTATRVLVSQSEDGELLAQILAGWGFSVARGSSSADGLSGARRALRALRDGAPVGLAVDGPKGPRGVIQDGALRLARRGGVPVVPIRVTGPGSWILDQSWDHFEIPRPGGLLEVEIGPEVRVAAGQDGLDRARARLEDQLGGDRPAETSPFAGPTLARTGEAQ